DILFVWVNNEMGHVELLGKLLRAWVENELGVAACRKAPQSVICMKNPLVPVVRKCSCWPGTRDSTVESPASGPDAFFSERSDTERKRLATRNGEERCREAACTPRTHEELAPVRREEGR